MSRFDCTYDPVGNILTWQQQADAAAPVHWSYGYDAADQLVEAITRTTGGSPTVLARYGYGYDAAGNRTTEQIDDAVLGVAVDARNRLVSQQPAGALRIAGQLDEPASVTINANLFWDGTDIIEERLSTGVTNGFFSDGESHKVPKALGSCERPCNAVKDPRETPLLQEVSIRPPREELPRFLGWPARG